MQNISGNGFQIQLLATFTFPIGITISQASDDSDPIDFPSMQIADKAMGLNGDLLAWSKANPIVVNIAVIPSSEDDKNLSILFNNNRVGRRKISTQDIITLTVTYPNSDIVTLNNGIITDGPPALSIASAGRLKTKTYSFSFENFTEVLQ